MMLFTRPAVAREPGRTADDAMATALQEQVRRRVAATTARDVAKPIPTAHGLRAALAHGAAACESLAR